MKTKWSKGFEVEDVDGLGLLDVQNILISSGVRANDGDGLFFYGENGEVKVRLLGVDAPEQFARLPKDRQEARQAKRLLDRLVVREGVCLVRFVGDPERDCYGRFLLNPLVGEAFVPAALTLLWFGLARIESRFPASIVPLLRMGYRARCAGWDLPDFWAACLEAGVIDVGDIKRRVAAAVAGTAGDEMGAAAAAVGDEPLAGRLLDAMGEGRGPSHTLRESGVAAAADGVGTTSSAASAVDATTVAEGPRYLKFAKVGGGPSAPRLRFWEEDDDETIAIQRPKGDGSKWRGPDVGPLPCD